MGLEDDPMLWVGLILRRPVEEGGEGAVKMAPAFPLKREAETGVRR
jgi:hypothetical protein